MRYPDSLKQKIMLAYTAAFIMMLVFISISWKNLRDVEHMVMSGENVSELFDTTLEIRRFEKNYFLYHQAGDYKELMVFVQHAQELLRDHRGEFRSITTDDELSAIEGLLSDYKKTLLTGMMSVGQSGGSWERNLREMGRSIVDAAEEIDRKERSIMQRTLEHSRRILIIMVLIFFAVAIGGAIYNYRTFVRPLRSLELHMDEVADGKFSPVPIETRDSEFVSLGKAFNRMLHELEERKASLVESEKLASLGTLLFGVAHELNNPLSNISTSSQILKEEIAEDDMEHKMELLQQIEDETDRAKNIVTSLLEYSRSKDKRMIRLKQLLKETISFLRGEMPTRVQVELNVPDNIEVEVDKQRMQQAFLNLLKNAVDAVGDEGKITIRAGINQKGRVEITFSDTGVGMEKELLGRIFNPFFTTKEGKKGYGLGLFIVHKIVREHGGNIIVNSEPGHGTTFLIELVPEHEVKHEEGN